MQSLGLSLSLSISLSLCVCVFCYATRSKSTGHTAKWHVATSSSAHTWLHFLLGCYAINHNKRPHCAAKDNGQKWDNELRAKAGQDVLQLQSPHAILNWFINYFLAKTPAPNFLCTLFPGLLLNEILLPSSLGLMMLVGLACLSGSELRPPFFRRKLEQKAAGLSTIMKQLWPAGAESAGGGAAAAAISSSAHMTARLSR